MKYKWQSDYYYWYMDLRSLNKNVEQKTKFKAEIENYYKIIKWLRTENFLRL